MDFPFPGDAGYDASDPFGNIRSDTGRPHLGSDWAAGAGSAIRCVSRGRVVANQWSSVLGWVVGVQDELGIFWGYAHQLRQASVAIGQVLDLRESFGAVGNTGSASKGNHLHLSAGLTFGAIFGEGYGSTLMDPHQVIVDHLAGSAGLPGSSTPVTNDRKAAAVTIPYSTAKYVDTVNPDRWLLIGSLGNVEIPGDGSQTQLAAMCEGKTVDLGPNALATLGRMQKLEADARKAIASGGSVVTEFRLSDAERASIADAVNDDAAARMKA